MIINCAERGYFLFSTSFSFAKGLLVAGLVAVALVKPKLAPAPWMYWEYF